jgi:hypothetical protein
MSRNMDELKKGRTCAVNQILNTKNLLKQLEYELKWYENK